MGLLDSFFKQVENKIVMSDQLVSDDGKIYYQDQLFTGTMQECHENGKVKIEIHYVEGIANGLMKINYESGKLFLTVKYSNGKKVGLETVFFENGNRKYETVYDNDRKKEKVEYYDSGKKKAIKRYKYVDRHADDVPHGVEVCWDENGNIVSQCIWEDGLPSEQY